MENPGPENSTQNPEKNPRAFGRTLQPTNSMGTFVQHIVEETWHTDDEQFGSERKDMVGQYPLGQAWTTRQAAYGMTIEENVRTKVV